MDYILYTLLFLLYSILLLYIKSLKIQPKMQSHANSCDSSFAYSATASLNSIATELNDHLNGTDYWINPELPR